MPAAAQLALFPLPRVSARLFADESFRRRSLEGSFYDPSLVDDAMIERVMRATRTPDYMSGMTAMMGDYREGDEFPLLKALSQPTLLVWGVEDRNKPSGEAELLEAEIPNAKLVRIPDAGHYVHEERPRATADAIREHAFDCRA